MPLYHFRCQFGHEDHIFAHIADRDAPRQCSSCGGNLARLLAAPAVRAEITPYRSPVTGQWVDSRAQRRDDLARSNSIEWEPGIRQDLPKIRESNWKKTMAPIEATIENTARRLVAEGKLDPL